MLVPALFLSVSMIPVLLLLEELLIALSPKTALGDLIQSVFVTHSNSIQ